MYGIHQLTELRLAYAAYEVAVNTLVTARADLARALATAEERRAALGAAIAALTDGMQELDARGGGLSPPGRVGPTADRAIGELTEDAATMAGVSGDASRTGAF